MVTPVEVVAGAGVDVSFCSERECFFLVSSVVDFASVFLPFEDIAALVEDTFAAAVVVAVVSVWFGSCAEDLVDVALLGALNVERCCLWS